MPAQEKKHTLQVAPVNIRAQLNATYNPAFPFSSPNPDDHTSLKSIRTGHTALSHNPFDSPSSSILASTDGESGATSEHDAWHLERYSEASKATERDINSSTLLSCPKGNRMGLQVITDFSKPTYHTNNLLIDQVKSKQAETRRNHARSIISQKAVSVSASRAHRSNGDKKRLRTRDATREKRRNERLMPSIGDDAVHSGISLDRVQSQKSILIGLRVPQDEANTFQSHDWIEGTATLATPMTPAIVLTTPEDGQFSPQTQQLAPANVRGRSRPISSVYSTITCSKDFVDEDDVPPVPPIALHELQNAIYSRYPIARTSSLKGHVDGRYMGNDMRNSPQNLVQISDICDTPKSQGWWNLLLSPLLSRAGSSASQHGREAESSPPPVPAIPRDVDNLESASTLYAHISPETPRRLGLAEVASTAWSHWSGREPQKDPTPKTPYGNGNSDYVLAGSKLIEWLRSKPDGTAAEYYQASVIEQLTGVPYFECLNHSCSHDPSHKVWATQDSQAAYQATPAVDELRPRGLVTLGSPFHDGKSLAAHDTSKSAAFLTSNDDEENDDSSSITEFESDDDVDKHVVVDEHSPLINHRPVTTPAKSPSEPDELSPNIRKANTAAVVRARALGSTDKSKQGDRAAVAPMQQIMPNIAAIMPGELMVASPAPVTPKKPTPMPPASLQKPVPALPASPAPQYTTKDQTTAPQHTVTEAESSFSSHSHPQILSQQFFMNPKGGFAGLPSTPTAARAFALSARSHSIATTHYDSHSRSVRKGVDEKSEFATPKSNGASWFNCLRLKKVQDPKEKKRRKIRLAFCICFLLMLIVILCIVLATTMTRRGDETTIGSRWLNLTGYPPMPTGISTVAQPELVQSQDACVQPSTLWSCSLPKDDQARLASNNAGNPQFRFEIKYRNGTTPANMNIAVGKRAGDPFTNDLFTANPAPPSDADQLFLGNTTDNVTAPFNGELTPFYITFMSTYPVVPSAFNTTKKALLSRQTNLGNNIPAPVTLPDGTAWPTTLLPNDPYPISQPIRLYNRGHVDEHYGFYMYYDKSVFLSGISITNGTANKDSGKVQSADQDGGSTKATARVRCTWQQIRFLVKIFTSPKFDGSVFPRSQNTTTVDVNTESEYSSATDFSLPGSFPYPASIVVDRHGGNINTKISYCYGMDKGIIDEDEKLLVFEDRASGGTLINGAPSFINNGTNGNFDSSVGGIDGGTGGCGCTWQNWQ